MVPLDAPSLLELTLADLLPVLTTKAKAGGCPLCARCDSGCEARARELLTPRAEAWAARFAQSDPAALLAGLIDHTILKPEATPAQVEALCREAREHHFASVCVNARFVPLCVRQLQGSGVLTCAVAGFPLGATSATAKIEETRQAVRDGAREMDVVLAIGEIKAGNDRVVQEEIARVAEVSHASGAILKVIVETALLEDAEKVRACQASVAAGAEFVKTSTGFAKSGATVYDVLLMRHTVGERVGVKAAGGIRTLADALKMLVAGASRLGASAGVALLAEMRGGT
jgi:deoxyribose-phosphate aldolase